MMYCSECHACEQGTETVTEQGEDYLVCSSCGFPADEVIRHFDEDALSERSQSRSDDEGKDR